MSLTESKSNLARLLSTEDLIVEQREGVATAFFDTKTRLLVVPKFKNNTSNDVLDLFLSHEVGHALHTPTTWNDACKENKIIRSINNVVEDNRIERLIKQKYPGLRVVYSRAYKELNGIDFFGISKLNFDEINIVDKINLTSKLGYISSISFNEKEQELFDKVNTTKTFDDVIRVCLEIQEYMKENFKKEYEEGLQDSDESEFLSDFEFDMDTISSDEETDIGGSFRGKIAEGFGESFEEMLEKYMESSTDNSAEEKIKELFSNSNKPSIYVDIPSVNIENIIVSHKTILSRLKKEVPKEYINWFNFNIFKKETGPIVSYLVKEFLLKKNAEGRKKIKISKTGDININKLFAYKVSDDIFKRSEIIPKSQSHGLVFFLDWSGSMDKFLEDTIKQLVTMLFFCRKMNIPYEVYAFSSRYSETEEYTPPDIKSKGKHVALIDDDVSLLNLFSSKMSNNEFIEMTNILLSMRGDYFRACEVSPKDDWYSLIKVSAYVPYWFKLGYTPLNHTILLSKKVVEKFESQYKVQKINAIYLTDGESHNVQFLGDLFSQERLLPLNCTYNNVYLRDKESKTTLMVKNTISRLSETNSCVSFLKEISNFKVFGFRLIETRELKNVMTEFFDINENINTVRSKLTKENCVKSTATAFDEFYLIRSNSLNKEEEELKEFGDKETIGNMTKKFQKAVGSKVNNRVFLRKFIEFIS